MEQWDRALAARHEWDQALAAGDVDAAVALYAPDATLVSHLLGINEGVVSGHENLRRFLEALFEHGPPVRPPVRARHASDGTHVTTTDADHAEFVEVMEIRDGLIRHHRVHWS
jgi:ketosteroid isomerase-like protein